MPRNGSGVYSKPAGTTAVPDTTIESAKYNSTIDDLVQDANTARPITAGGTGATSAASARTNLAVPGLATDNSMSGINTHSKIVKWAKGADVASASTLTLGDDGNYFDITGTTAITAIATKGVGTRVLLQFDAALTLTHHATDLVLPTGANITTAAGDHFEFVEYASGDWRCVGYSLANGRPLAQAAPTSGEFLRGYINGLTLSNNTTDATNDIDIAAGSAGSDGTTPVLMTLASALTKRLDASWAVGSGNGGLDTGSIANGWYYVWLIRRSDTGVVDALFSASATSPTMPTNYDQKRLFGAFERTSGAIRAFTQRGNDFTFVTPVENVPVSTTTISTTGALVTVTAPPLEGVEAKLRIFLSSSSTVAAWVRDTTQVNDAASISNADLYTASASLRSALNKRVFVNSSSQIRYRSDTASVGGFSIHTEGFIFPR